MIGDLTVADALVVATVPAVVSLVGVFGAIWIAAGQSRREWARREKVSARERVAAAAAAAEERDYQRRAEVERMLRVEKIELYQQLMAVSWDALTVHTPIVQYRRLTRLRDLLPRVHILASPEVVVAVDRIRDVLLDRHSPRSFPLGRASRTMAFPFVRPGFVPTQAQHAEEDELQTALLAACKADIDGTMTLAP